MADRITLLDIARQSDPDGKPAQVVEVLNQMNPILQDAHAAASNNMMGNRVTLRSALPTVDFAKLNKGVVKSKGATRQRTDTIGMFAGLSEVDSKLKSIVGAGRFDAARWNEDRAFLEAMSQACALNMFYGNEQLNEAAFTGLAPRMPAAASSITGSYVIDGGAAGSDTSSLYVVTWGENACSVIYPEGSTAGVEVRDKGEQRVTDADSNPFMAYVTAYDWNVGLTVRDPRHIGRVADIDISTAAADTALQLGLWLIDLLTAMPDAGGMQRIIYTHRELVAAFYKQCINKTNAALTMREYLGKPTPHFWDVPIRRCDQISNTESHI